MPDLKNFKLKEKTNPKDWNSVTFSFYIKKKNIKYYKQPGNDFLLPIMVVASKVKAMLFNRFFNLSKKKEEIKTYLDWFYENKSMNFSEPPEIYIIASFNFLYEWLKVKNQKVGLSGGYSRLRKF
jgi:hypothetical protein